MVFKRLALVAFVGALAPLSSAELKRVTDPAISPDGKTVAFVWQGDIWTAPSEGGRAQRLTVHPATESFPRWSPDGKWIAFASDRFGSIDVFRMSAEGGPPERVTYESATEYPTSWSPDGKLIYGYTNAWGRLDLFATSGPGRDMARLTGHPLELEYNPAVSPNGQMVAYNTGGSSGNWRKPGHMGSNTAKIWIADVGAPLGNHRMVLADKGNDLFPVWIGDTSLAFISNRSGTPNVWTGPLRGSAPKRLTNFKDGTIRQLTASRDGKLMTFQRDSQVWLLNSGSGKAAPINLVVPADSGRDPVSRYDLATGATDFAVSPNGKRIVFELRGDLFLIPEKGGVTRRLTTDPARDGQPVWLDDDRVLYVRTGPNGKRELATVDANGNVKPYLSDPTLDMNCPQTSPDRKKVAYHLGDRRLMVVAADLGGSPVKVVEADFSSSLSGSAQFSWSPDGEWLVYWASLPRSTEVAMARADGSGSTQLAKIGKGASLPRFTPDGKAVAFPGVEGLDFVEARGGASPLYAVDLEPQETKFDEDDLDKSDPPKKEDEPVKVTVEPRGLKDRRRKVTTADASAAWPGPEGRTVYSNVDRQISTVDLSTGTVKPLAGVTGPVSGLQLSADKKKLYYLQAGKLYSIGASGGTASPIGFRAVFDVDSAAEDLALFSEIWRTLDVQYYDPAHHGKDWPGIRAKFEPIVRDVQSREEFYDVMTEMMELLDSSHLGASAPGGARGSRVEQTAYLGVELDPAEILRSGRCVVTKVYDRTPASQPGSELKAGDVIETLNGAPVTNLAAMLENQAGRKVVLGVRRGGALVEVAIKPASRVVATNITYQDWVDWNRATVDRLSGERLGYVHIRGMDAPSLDQFLGEIQTELDGKQGVVVDVRYNGGGFTSHIILNVMRKEPWLIRTARDRPGVKLSENSYRGNALELPAVCLANQYSFSNAEIFSEGFRRMKLGPVVGEDTAGGVIGTSSLSLWDGGSVRVPASGAYTIDGENLEQNGRKPDFPVLFDPNAWAAGRDPMLEKAVQELMKVIDRR